ncbi:MAG: hypothetical protein H6853_09130 [Rhodospirillales bacterium]|nr:hypothetical protein [Alphaproteobacteria bacterium]USO03664.1 MAG: hypothetical protein H6853_09130 [Rhodospirillales bacterium]
MSQGLKGFLKTAAVAALPLISGAALAQDTDTGIQSRFRLVSADPETHLATINESGKDFVTDCTELEVQQSWIENSIIREATVPLSNNENNRLALYLGLGQLTYEQAQRNYPEQIDKDPGNQFKYAAQLGKERDVFIKAQKEAGCFVPKGRTLTPKAP